MIRSPLPVIRFLAILGLLIQAAPAQEAQPATQLRLTLPPVIYAVAGTPTAVYYDNVVLTQTPEDYQFVTSCSVGIDESKRWSLVPTDADVGEHRLKLTVRRGDNELAQAESLVKIVAADAGKDTELTLLLVGDSLTHATLYPNELARLLSTPGNPKWRMIGTHRPTSAREGVVHEGYGGWTWERFARHYEPNPDRAARKHSSPFVFLDNDQPRLDVERFLKEDGGGRSPDIVSFLLGINDCFSANPDSLAAIDERIDQVFAHAETLVAAFREAAPNADLAICLTTPPNARESGFEANYRGQYHRWGWKRVQHRLVERQLKQFGGREPERIFLVPTELNLDPVDGYPVDNGVHPNAAGYAQIGATLYAWTKFRLAERTR